PAQIRVAFPARTGQFHVFVDDRLHVSDAGGAKEFLLSLSASAKPQHVRMRWRYADSPFSVAPRLAPPSWDDTPMPGQQRVVWLPRAFTTGDDGGLSQPTFVVRRMHQAEIQMHLSDALAEEQVKEGEDHDSLILEHQKQLQRDIRLSDASLTLLDG